jgi:DNA-binding NtrC family response regulator
MPKRQVQEGRPCLLVGVPDEAGVARILREAGFDPEQVVAKSPTWPDLDRRPWAVVLAGQQVGPRMLESLITQAQRRRPGTPVVVLATAVSLQEAVDTMQLGAADVLAAPVSPEHLLARVRRLAIQAPRLEGEPPSFDHLGLTGRSPALAKVGASITRISRYKTNVLVLGESGTGKELIARALHAHGPRRRSLFVPLNCATLGREILENELFGHERGAFTGANERKKGLFELADGGTLFLDEIAELDPSTQAKLLRVLERNEFRRVGGTAKIKVDLSIIAATNRNLEDAVAAKRFREDLYYRLKVVTVVVPPLRARRDDIPSLADAFVADFNRRNDGKIRGISPRALRCLMDHEWPGNVRELKNAVESAAVMAAADTIELADFEGVPLNPHRLTEGRVSVTTGGEIAIPRDAALSEIERIVIGDRLERARTKAEAARSLGIGLRTLYSKIARSAQPRSGQARHGVA